MGILRIGGWIRCATCNKYWYDDGVKLGTGDLCACPGPWIVTDYSWEGDKSVTVESVFERCVKCGNLWNTFVDKACYKCGTAETTPIIAPEPSPTEAKPVSPMVSSFSPEERRKIMEMYVAKPDSPEHETDQLQIVKRRTMYLSGPMSGKPEFNAAEFAKYAEKYRALGWRVLSPPELDGGITDRPWQEYMRRDLRILLDENVTAVGLLPGWQNSRGACFEKHVAEVLGMELIDAETAQPYSENLLQEAHRLVHGDRGDAYSHPLDDFGRTAAIVSALLSKKLIEPVVEEDVALIMVAVKLSRLSNKPDHRDSAVDIAGYVECYQMVREERERRGREYGRKAV